MNDHDQALVLVIDDDNTVREVVRKYLTRDGLRVIERGDGISGLAAVREFNPDLVVLDLMLPGMDGLAVCEEIRRIDTAHTVPVIMLTALGQESDRVVGLEHGADDYVVKPFSPRELSLRVAGVLRRMRPVASAVPAAGAPKVLIDSDLRVDVTARSATRGGEPLALTTREFDLLAFFMNHPGKVYSRAELMEIVWGWSFGDQSTVTVHVRRLREKIEVDSSQPLRIATVWGTGYRFDSRPGS